MSLSYIIYDYLEIGNIAQTMKYFRITFRFYKSIIKEYISLLTKDKDTILEKRYECNYSLQN